jgi:hypothetical protein
MKGRKICNCNRQLLFQSDYLQIKNSIFALVNTLGDGTRK